MTLPASLPRQGLTLALGTLAGFAAYAIGLPLPWMLGPIIALTIAALAHAPVAAPESLRSVVIPVIGVMLGSSVTAEVLSALGRWATTMVILVPFVITAGTLSFLYYRRLGGYDQRTAFFAAMPGGLNDMMILARAYGGDERKVALAHVCRVLLVISLIALAFGLIFDVRANGTANWLPLSAPSLGDWAVLGGCALAGALIGRALRFSAGLVLFPLILSALAHGTGLVEIPPPSILVIAAQIVMGSTVGARFLGTKLREVGRDILLSLGSTALMLLAAIGFAALVTAVNGIPLDQTFLAFSPGGLTEMGLLAYAMGQDVAFVTITHLVRIFLVIFSAAPIFSWMMRRGG